MGRRSNSQKKMVAMLDNNDDVDDDNTTDHTLIINSSSSSSTTLTDNDQQRCDRNNNMVVVLDECLDALYENRGSTREKALTSIIQAFNNNNNIDDEFIEKSFTTLLHHCLNSINKHSSSPREITLASRVIGLVALTIGPGEEAEEILEASIAPIVKALKTRPELTLSSLLECLAVITFVGGEEEEQLEKSMQIMWQVLADHQYPKLGSSSSSVITTVIYAWSFLLTSIDEYSNNNRSGFLQLESWMSYFSAMLEQDDRSLRIAAGQALALIFEKFSGGEIEATIRNKVLDQMRGLSVEAGGKGASAKKDLNSQRNTFRDIVDYIEHPQQGCWTKVGGESIDVSTWVQLIRLNFLRGFLGGGFMKQMEENKFLHHVFGFMPKKKQLIISGGGVVKAKKKMYNKSLNKARTQLLNKQRMHFADDDEY